MSNPYSITVTIPKLPVDELARQFIELDNNEMLAFFESCTKQAKETYTCAGGLSYQFCWVVQNKDISQDCLGDLACLTRTPDARWAQ